MLAPHNKIYIFQLRNWAYNRKFKKVQYIYVEPLIILFRNIIQYILSESLSESKTSYEKIAKILFIIIVLSRFVLQSNKKVHRSTDWVYIVFSLHNLSENFIA